jgi:SNF2 family DNA or RNA helicase
MNILHAAWVPAPGQEFHQEGQFILWAERATADPQTAPTYHSFALPWEALRERLQEIITTPFAPVYTTYACLPSHRGQPLPSWDLLRYTGEELPESHDYHWFKLSALGVSLAQLPSVLQELNYFFEQGGGDLRPGHDLRFWIRWMQGYRALMQRDGWLPWLLWRAGEGNRPPQIEPIWRLIGDEMPLHNRRMAKAMPPSCRSFRQDPVHDAGIWEAEPALNQLSEVLLQALLAGLEIPKTFQKKLEGTLLADFYPKAGKPRILQSEDGPELYRHWLSWKNRLLRRQETSETTLLFRLQEGEDVDSVWFLEFVLQSRRDPSLQISLRDFWRQRPPERKRWEQLLGEDPTRQVLLELGQASRIYPMLWQALETDAPDGIPLSLEESYEFLNETAYLLEHAGFAIQAPTWWAERHQNRPRLRLQTRPGGDAHGQFGLQELVHYSYQLALGDQVLSPDEWRELVAAKLPLVRFRGQWVELDKTHLKTLLERLEEVPTQGAEMRLQDLLMMTADTDTFELAPDDPLQQVMERLTQKSKLELVPQPEAFQGQLREYQQRGVAWMEYLEQLGFNGCLADDMGLGKTVQVIARLLREREKNRSVGPTLLIAPTSVVGNWMVEMRRFAPEMKAMLHHSAQRERDPETFAQQVSSHDVVITSYGLIRQDQALWKGIQWARVVVDEAQNIRNPKAAQTKAIAELNARHRLALTGTPVENRLLDLWSIFHFLNPGYLGNQTYFRKSFEIPVQKQKNQRQTKILRQLVEPFILRRLKTDTSILRDLPEKTEQKVFCHLTPEQGSLYQAVVESLEEQLKQAEGNNRRGLILASLMKLKQICNHPAQYLQDGGAFRPDRSHKLTRLVEMISEVLENGESLLIFSQFREVCEQLDALVRRQLQVPCFLLHGGTSRPRREQMIEAFQSPDTGPAVFVLSLRAGGLGINLTRASQVFHFDRWWNPAVEEQATDRAYRIGQERQVFVHKFVSLGTLEERIDQLLEEKRQLSGSVLGADESWLSELDNETLLRLVALSRHAVLEAN